MTAGIRGTSSGRGHVGAGVLILQGTHTRPLWAGKEPRGRADHRRHAGAVPAAAGRLHSSTRLLARELVRDVAASSATGRRSWARGITVRLPMPDGRPGSAGPSPADDRVEARGEEQDGTGDDPLVPRRVRTLDEVAHAVDDDRDD
jgi:hypothetical protein